MGRPHAFWASAGVSLIVVDAVLDRRHDGSTLSECARYIYRTDTKVGRCALVASWAALSSWLIPHLLKQAESR